MKNIKFFTLVLVLTLFSGLFLVNSNVNAEEKEIFNYVSFGASNVNGYGLDGYLPEGTTAANKGNANVYGYERSPEGSYPQLIAEYYSEKYEVEHHQLGISSMRAEELRVLLDDSYEGDDYTDWRFTGGESWFLNAEPGGLDALRAAYKEHTTNADLITLDIGVNNFGVFLSHNLVSSNPNRQYHLEDIDPELAEYYELAKVYVKKLFVEAGISEQILKTVESFDHSIDIAAYALAGYCYNFDIIVDKIYEYNPDVQLVVVGVQHLLQDFSLRLPGVEQVLSFNDITGALVRAANLYISGISRHAKSYLFADVTENGHVEFFDKQMEEWDGDITTLDQDIIDCFNIYDDDLFIKDTVINYFNNSSTPWDAIGMYYGEAVQQELLNAAYYPIAKIMQAGCKIDFIDLAAYTSANTGAIENALLSKIFTELETSVLTKVAQITEAYTGTYEFDEEAFFNIDGVDTAVVKSIAGFAVYTGIGNSFFSHPNRAGHQEVADTVISAIENGTTGEEHAKAEVISILTSLYELAEKYGPSALQFIYNRLEEKGIIDQITNEVISIQNQIIDYSVAIESQIIAQLEAVKGYLEAKLEHLKANPIEAINETIAELEWAIASIESQLADAKAALAKAAKAMEPVIAELVELVEYLAAKPEVQKAVSVVLAKLENAANAYIDANVDMAQVEACLAKAYNTALVMQAKVVEISLEAKALYDELQAYAKMSYEEALEAYGKAKADLYAAYENAKIEETLNAIIEELTGAKANVKSEVEAQIEALHSKIKSVYADIQAYANELEAKVTTKVEEIYNDVVSAYMNSTAGSYVTSVDSYYVALGDSSAANESYVDLIANELNIENYANLAQKGMRLEDVLYLLSDVDSDQYYKDNFASLKEDMIAYVEAADIITLGFNNMDFVLAQFGTLDPAKLDWAQYIPEEYVSAIEMLLAKVDAELENALGEYKDIAMTVVSSLVYNYVGSLYHYSSVIEAINRINPEALVVSIGMYNPFAQVSFEYEGTVINVGEYYGYLINAIYALHLIDAMVYGNAIVVSLNDVETEFDAIVAEGQLDVTIADVATQLFTNAEVFLPSEVGHKAIADAVLAVVSNECQHVADDDDHDCTTPVVCQLCGIVLEEGAEEHTEQVIPAVPSTCTQAGSTEGVMCSVCGKVLVAPEEVAKLDHVYDNQCDNECNICGASNANLGDHVYDNRCDEDCNICGGMRRVLGHVFGEWVVVEESTKKVQGKEGRVCSECGYVEYRLLPLAEGIGTGAIIAVASGSTIGVAAGGFSVFWFGIKKRKFSDLKKIFKK